MAKWDAVVFTAPDEQTRQQIEKCEFLVEFKQKPRVSDYIVWKNLGLLLADEWLAIEDACPDVGSAGSSLNALLVATERLCALKGLSVLNEQVLFSSRILIVLVGDVSAIHDNVTGMDERIETRFGYVPRSRVVQCLANVDRIAERTRAGVWITGTNASYDLNDPKYSYSCDSSNSSNLVAFSFTNKSSDELIPHGIYETDQNAKQIRSLSFCVPSVDSNVLLALIYFPPLIARLFLSLYSVYPLMRSTYHGLDSGTVGLKLSLFFDILPASLISEAEFYTSTLGGSRIDCNDDLRRLARKEIRNRMDGIRLMNEQLDIDHYAYFEPNSKSSDDVDKLKQLYENYAPNIVEKIEKKTEKVDKVLRTIVELESLNGPALNINFKRGMDLISQATPILEISGEETVSEENQRRYKPVKTNKLAVESILKKVEVQAAARIDLYGGWLDTPPITFQFNPSAVVNVAVQVDGRVRKLKLNYRKCKTNIQKPIKCCLEKIDNEGISFTTEGHEIQYESINEIIESSNKPEKPGSLLCACIIASGLIDAMSDQSKCLSELINEIFHSRGIRITTQSLLPHGSGLGTSSILASTIIACLWTAANYEFTNEMIVHTVLLVEQILSTAGGWQDQVGCIYAGFKIGSMTPNGVIAKQINTSPEFLESFNQRMVLIYTGKTRLAKNLLQQVLRNFYSGGDSCNILQSMSSRVEDFAKFIEDGNNFLKMSNVIHLNQEYYQHPILVIITKRRRP
ncbi:hypothetical protein WR25_16690 isoform H [Diploscapter pachys]|uniref:GHMP kinase N-terminal domain-containing protein n=1 Tax=Diploscapter pachys TaxID=2018661 RepID=A0A2A2LU15_9BILA|nr:hypothetical protein WR25_16690 isoform C [Diploscapter pachys]PAV89660.1 hypothetical protein WR25_16690 isoform H [Diploscapter pachys]